MQPQCFLISDDALPLFSPLLPDQTVKALRRQGNIFAIGAACGGQACGVLVFQLGESLCHILYLAVSPDLRRQGIGQEMVNFLCAYAMQNNLGVLCAFAAPDERSPVYRFFQERWDFTVNEDVGEICRIPLPQLEQLKLPNALPPGCRVKPFFQMPSDLRGRFLADLSDANREFFQGLEGQTDQLLPPLCLCAADQASIRAALFCHQQEGDVSLSFLCARPGEGICLTGLLSHLRALLMRAADRVPYLWISAVTPETQKLVTVLAPQRETISRFYLASWDET